MSDTERHLDNKEGRHEMGHQPVAVLFTQQTVGLGARKTGMVFWAESLAQMGWRTQVVTVQLSALSKFGNSSRLAALPATDLNVWRNRGENLEGFIWVPPLHPARLMDGKLDAYTGFLCALYPVFLPQTIKAALKDADLVVIESCSAVALFETVRKHAPKARIVYCASDRLTSVGMHAGLSKILDRTAPQYDLVRVPARSMLDDFGSNVKAAFIPHGVDKQTLDRSSPSPYRVGSRNAVLGGDMMFDRATVEIFLDEFPEIDFHLFGKMKLDGMSDSKNVVIHGEVPFAVLATFLKHADVGIAPYLDRPDLNYLSESSLKLMQYTYCRLPIVAPKFVRSSQSHIFGYESGNRASCISALARALSSPKPENARDHILEWKAVVGRALDLVGLPH